MDHGVRGALLTRIRAALADSGRLGCPEPLRPEAVAADLLPLFVDRCTRANASVHVLPTYAAARERLARLAVDLDARSVTVSPRAAAALWSIGAGGEATAPSLRVGGAGSPSPGFGGAGSGPEVIVRRERTDADPVVSADIGVTLADYAVADTGTLVLLPSADEGRLDSLLPPVHVALVHVSALRPHLWALADDLQCRGAFGEHSAIVFVTGPSRTADIELTLTIGVHGPIQAHVLMVDDRPGAPSC